MIITTKRAYLLEFIPCLVRSRHGQGGGSAKTAPVIERIGKLPPVRKARRQIFSVFKRFFR